MKRLLNLDQQPHVANRRLMQIPDPAYHAGRLPARRQSRFPKARGRLRTSSQVRNPFSVGDGVSYYITAGKGPSHPRRRSYWQWAAARLLALQVMIGFPWSRAPSTRAYFVAARVVAGHEPGDTMRTVETNRHNGERSSKESCAFPNLKVSEREGTLVETTVGFVARWSLFLVGILACCSAACGFFYFGQRWHPEVIAIPQRLLTEEYFLPTISRLSPVTRSDSYSGSKASKQ